MAKLWANGEKIVHVKKKVFEIMHAIAVIDEKAGEMIRKSAAKFRFAAHAEQPKKAALITLVKPVARASTPTALIRADVAGRAAENGEGGRIPAPPRPSVDRAVDGGDMDLLSEIAKKKEGASGGAAALRRRPRSGTSTGRNPVAANSPGEKNRTDAEQFRCSAQAEHQKKAALTTQAIPDARAPSPSVNVKAGMAGQAMQDSANMERVRRSALRSPMAMRAIDAGEMASASVKEEKEAAVERESSGAGAGGIQHQAIGDLNDPAPKEGQRPPPPQAEVAQRALGFEDSLYGSSLSSKNGGDGMADAASDVGSTPSATDVYHADAATKRGAPPNGDRRGRLETGSAGTRGGYPMHHSSLEHARDHGETATSRSSGGAQREQMGQSHGGQHQMDPLGGDQMDMPTGPYGGPNERGETDAEDEQHDDAVPEARRGNSNTPADACGESRMSTGLTDAGNDEIADAELAEAQRIYAEAGAAMDAAKETARVRKLAEQRKLDQSVELEEARAKARELEESRKGDAQEIADLERKLADAHRRLLI